MKKKYRVFPSRAAVNAEPFVERGGCPGCITKSTDNHSQPENLEMSTETEDMIPLADYILHYDYAAEEAARAERAEKLDPVEEADRRFEFMQTGFEWAFGHPDDEDHTLYQRWDIRSEDGIPAFYVVRDHMRSLALNPPPLDEYEPRCRSNFYKPGTTVEGAVDYFVADHVRVGVLLEDFFARAAKVAEASNQALRASYESDICEAADLEAFGEGTSQRIHDAANAAYEWKTSVEAEHAAALTELMGEIVGRIHDTGNALDSILWKPFKQAVRYTSESRAKLIPIAEGIAERLKSELDGPALVAALKNLEDVVDGYFDCGWNSPD